MTPIVDQDISTFLSKAFPAHLGGDVRLLSNSTEPMSHVIRPGIEIKIAAENLAIPVRLYQLVDERVFSKLPDQAGTLYSCILTRHYDGYLRQRQLARIIDKNLAWVVPFVLQLASEYVVEILDDIEKNFAGLDTAVYAQFMRENPVFYMKAKHRMISYWDCYHRRLYKYKNDYVGFRLFSLFDALIDEKKGETKIPVRQ